MSKFTDANLVTLLRNGQEYFPALITAIQEATQEIYLLTYIFELDVIGSCVGDALKQAASRGVKVYMLLDGFGCKDLSTDYINGLQNSGIKVLIFNPKISPWTLQRSRLRRMHSKMVVIDYLIGFVGGINVIDDYHASKNEKLPRIDYAIKVEGALVERMRKSAMSFFKANFFVKTITPSNKPLKHKLTIKHDENVKAAFLIRDNFRHRREIEAAYLNGIRHAKKEIIIANAYFLPGIRFRHALRNAAARGVKVTLLLQSKVEFLLLDLATRALYTSLLESGVVIYEYHQSAMHSKVAVIDEHWAMVGSSNIDPFSLLLSHEANVLVDDAEFNKSLKDDLKKSIEEGADLVTLEAWSRRSLFQRFISWLVYGFVRLLIGFSGYSK
ncbi:MAG: cardiolipin synthase ClsB [Methylophilaceae bacterium]